MQISTAFALTINGGFVLNGANATLSRSRLLIIIEEAIMKKEKPIHPGEILREEFLSPLNVSQTKLAEDTGIALAEVEKIVAEKSAISPNAALRLSLYFGLSERFWLNLQSRYDLETEKDKVADKLKKEVRILQAA